MKITVLLFGISTDLIGSSSINFDLSEDSTVGDFKNYLQEHYPNLTQLNSYAVAVNESYASEEIVLKENDIVAIIPPVSGG